MSLISGEGKMEIEYQPIEVKRILEKGKKASLFNCDYIVSPYVGCEYNCVYCNNCLGSEPPKDFNGVIQIKENAPTLLKKELKRTKNGMICVVGYQHAEKDYRIIGKVLEILNKGNFPVHIITRSDIVLDDLDILTRISQNRWCAVTFLINTLDEGISNIFEPDVPSPKRRLEALEKLVDANIPCGMALMPVIPYITDTEDQLDEIIGKAADLKTQYVLFEPLALEGRIRARIIDIIKREYPGLVIKYRNLYEFGSSPDVKYTRQLRKRVNKRLKKYNLLNHIPAIPLKPEKKQIHIDKFIGK